MSQIDAWVCALKMNFHVNLQQLKEATSPEGLETPRVV
jgi:hypothetical protein